MNQILLTGQGPEENNKKEKKKKQKENNINNNYTNIKQENNYMNDQALPMDNNYMNSPVLPMDNNDMSNPVLPMEDNYMSNPASPMGDSYISNQTFPMDNSYMNNQSLPMEDNYMSNPEAPMDNNNMSNQALPTEENYNTNTDYTSRPQYNANYNYSGQTTAKADIAKVIKVFCITIILFGLILIGNGTYAIIKAKNNQKDTPNVNIEKMGREATITISTEKPIREYSYRWNEGERTTEKGDGKITIEKTVQIPNGNNILRIEVVDYYGNRTKHFKQYIYESTDVNKPEIELAAVGTKLKITAKDDVEMLYMTYKWDDEEAVRIDVSSEDKKVIEEAVEVPEGNHRLTIVAVDKEENRETRTESVIGDTKPTFELSTDGQNIIVVANDDQGISKISITIDGQTTDSGDAPINQTSITAKMPITSGTHEITVVVTNINGLTETQSVTHTF